MNKLQLQWSYPKIKEFIFYGNYFYGLCAVALSIEAALQQRIPLNSSFYFFLFFITTVLYYGYPYARKYKNYGTDPRTNWYITNYRFVRWNQIFITFVLMGVLVFFLHYYVDAIIKMNLVHWAALLIFPFVAALYYGINFFNIRKVGWLKPFIIGFTWAGLVTVYPVLFYNIIHKQDYTPTLVSLLLFIKNLMFVSVLCIMFDVKDYATDHISRLKTFVVQIGLRKTIFNILLPLSMLGLVSFIYYAVDHQFHAMKTLLNVVPFILMLMAVISLRKRRTLMYYLVVIDSLMLVKAACGILAVLYF